MSFNHMNSFFILAASALALGGSVAMWAGWIGRCLLRRGVLSEASSLSWPSRMCPY